MHAVLITTYNRLNLLTQCIESIKNTEPKSPIFVIDDGSEEDTKEYLLSQNLEMVLLNKSNIGVSPSLEIGINAINNWYRFRKADRLILPSDILWVSWVQDDVVFKVNSWYSLCMEKLCHAKNDPNKIGFITGHEAPEHAKSGRACEVPDCLYRDHIRATHMLATIDEWKLHFPISCYQKYGLVRGHPTKAKRGTPARGADEDWWILRDHANSVLRRGKTNLVVQGILSHIGHEQSSWQITTPEGDS